MGHFKIYSVLDANVFAIQDCLWLHFPNSKGSEEDSAFLTSLLSQQFYVEKQLNLSFWTIIGNFRLCQSYAAVTTRVMSQLAGAPFRHSQNRRGKKGRSTKRPE